MVAPLREQHQELNTEGKKIVAVITEDRVIDANFKRQIKNRTLYTCRLFLLTWIFQYVRNWAKVFYPHSFFNVHS